jgi:hypothetical protein
MKVRQGHQIDHSDHKLYNIDMSDVGKFEIDGKILAVGSLSVGNLPNDYIEQSIQAIHDTARVVMFKMGVTTNNRDLDHVGERLATVVAPGENLTARLPLFNEYYHDELRNIASEAIGEEAICLSSLNEVLIGLAFGPGMRIEAHTDVWAINANLFLKVAPKRNGLSPELAGGTIIGHKNAGSHTEILANPLAIVAGRVGTLGVIACSEYPHTIGVAETSANFEHPDITDDAFWDNPETRMSLNVSYTTEAQLVRQPLLRPMSEEVGYSRPVLGSSLPRVLEV